MNNVVRPISPFPSKSLRQCLQLNGTEKEKKKRREREREVEAVTVFSLRHRRPFLFDLYHILEGMSTYILHDDEKKKNTRRERCAILSLSLDV